jgi:hypothetical protein
MRQRGGREKINGDGQKFVGKGKFSCDMLRAADLKTASIGKSEWDLGQGLSDKKGGECRKISELD